MSEILKVKTKLGKHFDQDAWQRSNAEAAAPASAPASALAKAANKAKVAPPASALVPASGSASALVEAEVDPKYFATWVAERVAELPKNGLRLKM